MELAGKGDAEKPGSQPHAGGTCAGFPVFQLLHPAGRDSMPTGEGSKRGQRINSRDGAPMAEDVIKLDILCHGLSVIM